MFTSRCMPAVFSTPIVSFAVPVANSRAIGLRKQLSVVEASGIREGAGLRSDSSRGSPYEMSSRCRPVAVARLC